MKKRLKRMAAPLVIGLGVFVGGLWLLSQALGNCGTPTLYHGEPQDYWVKQLNSHDTGASNRADAVLNTEIIPRLGETILRDTNDSSLRLALVENLNQLPGIDICFINAETRRSEAAMELGEFGPAAKAAIPALVQVLNAHDDFVLENAIAALGKIHGQPEVVVPLLMTYLDDDDLNDNAAEALGNFGSLARAAVPKLILLLKNPDPELREAVVEALKQIDPEAYAKAKKDMDEIATATPKQTDASPGEKPDGQSK